LAIGLWLEVFADGFGFLRSPEANYLPGPPMISMFRPEMIPPALAATGTHRKD